MSFLGGKPAASTVPTQLNAINVDQSKYGLPISLVYGVQRIPINLGWYNAFQSTPVSEGGGKGGGSPPSSFAYSASMIMLMCEGLIGGSKQLWKDKDLTTLAAEGLTLFTGASGQAIWSYLTSSFPSQAIPYDGTAYLGGQNLQLGGSAAVPNYTIEVIGLLAQPGTPITFTGGFSPGATSGTLTSALLASGLWDITFSSNESRTCTISGTAVSWDPTLGLTLAATAAAVAGGLDAEASAVLVDYCTDPKHGAGFNNLSSTNQGTGATTWQTYCIANGLGISPLEDTQRAGTDFLKDLLEITNSNGFMSAGQYFIKPYGDTAVAANGRAYTPNLTPLFSFDDDDFMPNSQGTNDDPVILLRAGPTETYNTVRIEFLDRGNSYNTAIAQWSDPLDVQKRGIRLMPMKTFHQICDARVAYNVAALIGQRQLYVRNRYQFCVRPDYSLLEPMDLVEITDLNLGLVNALVRITETQDDENDNFMITAEEMLVGTNAAPKYNFQPGQGYAANFNAAPIAIATPLVFTAPPALVSGGGGYELWVAAGPSAAGEYGGAYVYASMDGTAYSQLGQIGGQARYGTASAVTATATSITLTINAAATADGLQLSNASASDFAANRALMWLDGEIIGFENVSLVSAGVYTVSPISRGLFGTGPSQGVGVAHSAGAAWARLDESIFSFPIDPGMIGQTIDLKLPTFNSVGRAVQDLSAATAFSHLITASSGNALTAGLLKLVGRGVTINGNNAFKSKATSAWDSDAYSVQGYTNGAFVSFQPGQTNQNFGFGLNHDPTTDSNFTSIDYWLECGGGGTLEVWNNGSAAFSGGAYAIGDVLTVSYDGAFVRYAQNGTVFFQQPAAANQTLYADSSFFDPGATANNIQFGPIGTATPVIWIARGAATVSDENVQKGAGSIAFDSDAYSISGYLLAHIIWKTNNSSSSIIAGFQSGAPTSAPGGNCSFAIHNNLGSVDIIEGGTVVASAVSTYVPTDLFAITYDGTTVTYSQNGTTLHTTAASGLTMYGSVTIASPFAFVNSLEFGPGALVPLADTGQLNLNAATTTVSTTVTGTSAGANFAAPASQNSVTVGPFPVATTVVVTVSASYSAVSAGLGTSIAIEYGISTSSTSFSGNIVKQLANPSTPTSVSQTGVLSCEATFSLAPNTTQTYFFVSGLNPSGVVGSGQNFDFLTIKAEVIKR